MWLQLRRSLLVRGVENDAATVCMATFSAATVDEGRLTSSWAQVLYANARQLEGRLAEQVRGEDVADGDLPGLPFEKSKVRASSRDMEERLFHYVTATVEASRSYRVFSTATDKASPAGMHLQNSRISFGANATAMCCPGVAESQGRFRVPR